MTAEKDNLEQIFDFLHKVEKLKSTLRYNQTTTGRKESSADHSWRLALFVMLIVDELKLDIDANHCIKMALVHDLAEAETGDIDAIEIAEGRVLAADKETLEIKAMVELAKLLPTDSGQEVLGLWHEYNDKTTKEAKLVKALDKIETLTQIVEAGYETYDKPAYIANYADKYVKECPELMPTLQIVKRKLKEEFTKGKIEWKAKYDL